MEKDEYKTVKAASEGLYKEKGSRFFSYLYPVKDEQSISNKIQELKGMHPKSRHVCYSYLLGVEGSQFRINDDGEPSGTAGRPIYNELISNELTYILLAVVRYLGGTKLGASGLIRAYKESAKDALAKSTIITKYVNDYAYIHFDHHHTGRLYNSLKRNDIEIIDQQMGLENWIKIGFRKSLYEAKMIQLLSHFHQVSEDYVNHDSFVSKIKIKRCE